jgi:chlorite dismutase
MPERTFVKYTFIKVDPAWRRRDAHDRAQDKREFAAACNDFAEDHYLRTYTLVGTRGDSDLMVRSATPNLEAIHELHVVLNQSGLMRHADIAYSYLAVTKESIYADEPQPLAPRSADHKYLIVYPMWKKRDWYGLSADERMRIMREHITVARRFPNISTNTAYSFGLDDQEFVVAFESDYPEDFLDLVEELRGSVSSSFTARDVPIFSCIATEIRDVLNALGGTRIAIAI